MHRPRHLRAYEKVEDGDTLCAKLGYLPLEHYDDGSGVLSIQTEGEYMDYFIVEGKTLAQMKALYKPDGMTRVLSRDPEIIVKMAEVDGQGAESLPDEHEM